MNFLIASDRRILAALHIFKRTAQAAIILLVLVVVAAQALCYTAREAYESGTIVRRWFDNGGAEQIARVIAVPVALGIVVRRRFDQHHVADVALTVVAVVWLVAGALRNAAVQVSADFAEDYFAVEEVIPA